MSNRCIFKFWGGFLCLSVIFLVLMFFLQDDSPLYEWVLFEDTRKKADDIILVSDSDSVPSGYNEIQLTVTNNSVYTIVVHFRSIEIQKFEDGSWYTLRSTQEYISHDSNSMGYIGYILEPGEFTTYNLLLTDFLPFSLQSSGDYRIYCPLSFRLDEEDDSKILRAYISTPMAITNE